MSPRSTRMVIQTQTVGAARKAFCGLYSINNAMQIYDFISVDEMKTILHRIKAKHPAEDHGDETYGHYSVMALQQALQSRGFNLIFLNRMKFLRKARRSDWHKRLATTSFRRVIIIGRPPHQKKDISHCIARVARTIEQVPNKRVEKPVLICPDLGELKPASEGSLDGYLPELDGAYAILSHAELAEMKANQQIPKDAEIDKP